MRLLADARETAVYASYYGESTPFGSGNLTTNNLKYLSAQQVMLDLMLMREQAIRQFKCPNSPWILMGGSWPGALAAWTRVMYVGAIAEAAPVNITLSSPQWNQVVASVMGPGCVERVVEMFGVLGDMIQTPSGFAELTQTFSFLSTAPTVYPYDSSPGNMMYTLTTLVWGAAETNFGTPAVYPWKFPMQYMCTKLLEPRSINDTIAQFVTLAKQYTAWANLIGSNNMLPTYRLFNYQRYRCISTRARNRRGAVPLIRHAPSRCTQIPIWNGYDADSRLFYPGPLIGPELLLANCKIDFGGGLIPNAHKTNLRFAGGRKPQFARTAGNIAFINDLWDPTHSLTPMRDLSSSVKAINLPNMAHGGFLVGLILYPNPADRPPEFEQAIDTVGGLISSWIAEYHEQSRWLAEEQQ